MTSKAESTQAPRQSAIVLLPVGAEAVRDPALRLAEAVGLAEALDLNVHRSDAVPVRRTHPNAYFGQGRVDALKAEVDEAKVDVLVVDASLSPVQQRNLERGIGAKVVDRTGLILEIFGRRARTREGVLQVELARLGYERSRLVRTWTHLERQRGGLGKTGGPGETQIELDRRLIAQRIDKLKLELQDVRRTRGLQRRARKRAGLPTVVLVGYTNAGKSSLFNRLTAASVLAKNMPFATLDPTARAVRLKSGRSVIMSDTVGFITDLPTELVESFRATLEEITTADLLVHVRDVAHEETDSQRRDVLAVLDQLYEDEDEAQRPPMVEAWNKIDLMEPAQRESRRNRAGGEHAVAISAVTGEGVDELLEAIDNIAFGPTCIVTLSVDPADGRTPAAVASIGRILSSEANEDGSVLRVVAELPSKVAQSFVSEFGLAAE